MITAPGIEETKTRRAIVKLLKTEGGMDSAQMAERLDVTAMAVRQHLYALEEQKLVSAVEKRVPVGRPVKIWELTRAADRLFPDAYAELSLALINAMSDAFGASGLERILETRSARQRKDYSARIPSAAPLQRKLEHLARIRSDEGYMAEVKPLEAGSFLFVENHCPICAAASTCQGFCATELELFGSVLGPGVKVERSEHILAGARRCAYRVTRAPKPRSGS